MLRNPSSTHSLRVLHFSLRRIATAPNPRPPNPATNAQNHTSIRNQILSQGPLVRGSPLQDKGIISQHSSSIRRHIRAKSLPQALEQWSRLVPILNQHDPSRPIAHPVERELSDYITKAARLAYSDLGSNPGWSEKTVQQFEEFSLEMAKIGQPDIVYAYMLENVTANRPDPVISLYEKFLSTMGGSLRDILPHNSHDLLEEVDQDAFDPAYISVVLTAIAAHALKDSIEGAFKAYMDSGIRIRTYQKTRLMENIASNEILHSRMLEYLPRLHMCYLLSNPAAFIRHVGNIAQPATLKTLLKFYRSVLEGITGKDAFIAPSEASPERLVAVPETAWSAIQTGFLKCNRRDLAAGVWQDLKKLGVVPGVSMWTGLLDYWADLRNLTEAERTWEAMLASNVEPDVLSYRAFIAVSFDDGKPDAGMRRFREYQSNFGPATKLGYMVYNTVLQGLLRNQQLGVALELLETMKKTGPPPDLTSFNTLLSFYAKLNDFRGMSNVLAGMTEAGIKGDVVTFSTLLSALLRIGRKDAVPGVLLVMKEQGIEPNVATYTSIITSLMRDENTTSLKAALDLLLRMEQDPALKPNEVTYTTILSGLYRGDWLEPKEAEVVKKELLGRMRRKGIPMTLRTYHILIREAMCSSNEDGYKDALALFAQMEKDGIQCTQTTWHLLFSGLVRRRQWRVGRELAKTMHLQGFVPSAGVARLLNEIRQHA